MPVFMALLLSDLEFGAILSAAVFILAAATDGIDGYVARIRQETSFLGEVIDHLADKLLISAALISLVGLGRLSAWIAVVIIAREFLISSLRIFSIKALKRFPSSKWGKAKTFAQIVAVTIWVVLPQHSIQSKDLFYITGVVVMLLAIVLTIYSAIDYFKLTLPLIDESIKKEGMEGARRDKYSGNR